jgi:hypothetical protein
MGETTMLKKILFLFFFTLFFPMDSIKRFYSNKISSFHNNKRQSSLRRYKSSKRSIFSSNSTDSNQSIEEDEDDYSSSSKAMMFLNTSVIKTTRSTVPTKPQSTDKNQLLLRTQKKPQHQDNNLLESDHKLSRKNEKKRLSLSPQFHKRETSEKKPDIVSID